MKKRIIREPISPNKLSSEKRRLLVSLLSELREQSVSEVGILYACSYLIERLGEG